MNCSSCGKDIKKHSEDELYGCLSSFFEQPYVFGNVPSILGFLLDRRVDWLTTWGQPHIGTGTYLVTVGRASPKELTIPEILRLVAEKEMAEKPKPKKQDAERKDTPEDTP